MSLLLSILRNIYTVKTILAVLGLVSILVLINANNSFAEIDPEKQSIIENCERLYPEFEVLGREKFEQRYMYNKDLRNCLRMYNSPSWGTTDPDRETRLVAVMDIPVAQRTVRDQTVHDTIIPQWIKDDATRWYKGQEKDSTLSFGIRQLVSSKMIQVSPHTYNINACHDTLCVSNNDYLAYSIAETGKASVIQKHTIHSTGPSFLIQIDQTTSTGTDRTYLQVSRDGIIEDAHRQCCSYYQFAHKTPLEIGSKVNSVKEITITHELVYAFNNIKRPAFFAVDSTGYYQEVIDKATGVVLFAKNQDNIRKVTKTTSLTNTNLFQSELRMNYGEIHIPPWFRDPVKWWAQGQISDEEYLKSLSYLIKNNVLRI